MDLLGSRYSDSLESSLIDWLITSEVNSMKEIEKPKFRKGIYETCYGNSAMVSGPNAKTAYDLDSAERISITLVTSKFLRKVESCDTVRSY